MELATVVSLSGALLLPFNVAVLIWAQSTDMSNKHA